MKKLVGFALVFLLWGCAKLMEDQPGTQDSTQSTKDSVVSPETTAATSTKVPERFMEFYDKEFRGSVGATGGSTQTIDVKTIMDVKITLNSEAKNMQFIIKKDGLDITEMPSNSWQGRLVPGRYLVAIIPDPYDPKPASYSLVVKEN